MAKKMGVVVVEDAELGEIKQDVSPEAVLDGIETEEARH